MLRNFTFGIGFLLCTTFSFAQSFVEVGAITQVDIGGNKDGGVAWGDFNNDGCPDLILNTDDNTQRSRILMSDCNLPNPVFTDVTSTHAAGLLGRRMERTVIWADFNNDGYLDFGRNTHNRFEIYANKGPFATPPFSFGDASQDANLVINSITGGMNTEGFGWMDYNADGWLDLVVENHNFGIDIFENPADGSANFFHVTPNNNLQGLPKSGRTGDYMCLSDFDNDGFVDILARKEDIADLWRNTGNPGAAQFVANATFDQQADNNNKGGVLMADFDNDGDFDIFWGDNGANPNQIFLQTTPGVFAATMEPSNSIGTDLSTAAIDGCAAADVNNDGKIDLFLADGSGQSYLMLNTTPNGGTLSFTRNNLGIDVNANAEGCAFVDYDVDGDMDLYVNVKSGANQLWRNTQNDQDFLEVQAMYDAGTALRYDVGATVVLKDCSGNIMSGIRDVNGTRGHGSQDVALIHFGLSVGPDVPYVVEVGFTNKFGTRTVIEQAVIPSALTNQRIQIVNTGSSDLTLCAPLPLDARLELSGKIEGENVHLSWLAEEDQNTEWFEIERSIDGAAFEQIDAVESEAMQKATNTYDYLDRPQGKVIRYRINMVDIDGKRVLSEPIEIVQKGKFELKVYPNPIALGHVWNLRTVVPEAGEIKIELYGLRGKLIRKVQIPVVAGGNDVKLESGAIGPGIYFLVAHSGAATITHKVVVR